MSNENDSYFQELGENATQQDINDALLRLAWLNERIEAEEERIIDLTLMLGNDDNWPDEDEHG